MNKFLLESISQLKPYFIFKSFFSLSCSLLSDFSDNIRKCRLKLNRTIGATSFALVWKAKLNITMKMLYSQTQLKTKFTWFHSEKNFLLLDLFCFYSVFVLVFLSYCLVIAMLFGEEFSFSFFRREFFERFEFPRNNFNALNFKMFLPFLRYCYEFWGIL